VPKSFCQKITDPNCKHIKAAPKKLLYEKAAQKILVKLTPACFFSLSIKTIKLFQR
jgi:hypothetical protein